MPEIYRRENGLFDYYYYFMALLGVCVNRKYVSK